MKRYLSMILVVVMLLSMLPQMSAASTVKEQERVEPSIAHASEPVTEDALDPRAEGLSSELAQLETLEPTGIHNYEDPVCSASEEELGEPDNSGTLGNLYWAFYRDEYTLVISGEGDMERLGSVSFPWNEYKYYIRRIVIQPGVTSVGSSAFFEFRNLIEVKLPDTVTKIGRSAFYSCYNLEKINLPSSLITIEEFAFRSCASLVSITIPDSVTSIERYAFNQCDDLKQITIPDSVTFIGDHALGYCDKLESVHIGSGVSSMGNGVFGDSDNIKEISVAEGNLYFMVDGRGILFDKEQKTLVLYPPTLEGDTYTIPDSVETIAPYAFNYNRYLRYISIGNHVKIIGDYAFCTVTGLRTVEIGNSVTEIGDGAFSYCKVLDCVEIGDSVTTIGRCAFYACYELKEIVLPDSVVSLGGEAFLGCKNLQYIKLSNRLSVISEETFLDCKNLKTIYIPASVTDIEERAFYNCEYLYCVHFMGNKPNIGQDAFYEVIWVDPECDFPVDRVYSRIYRYIEGTTGWETFEHDLVPWVYEYHDYCHEEFYYCPECRTEYVISKDGTHEWDEGRITTEPNCVMPGSCTYTCTVCSVVKEETLGPNDSHCYEFDVCIYCALADPNGPKLDETIKVNHTLNLASDISINYLVRDTMLRDCENVYMECLLPVYEGNTLVGSKRQILEPTQRDGYYYFTLDGIISSEMNNVVKVRIHGSKDGVEYVSAVDEYSVATYAYKQLANSNIPEPLKAVCANLLQYGAKVQLWKGYHTDALADGNMTKEMKAYLTDLSTVRFNSNKAYLGDLADPAVMVKGVSMQLNSKIIVRYIIDAGQYGGNPEDLSLKISYIGTEGEKEVTLTNITLYNGDYGYYAFDFDGLFASELRTVMSVAVYAGDTKVSETLEYSVDSYGNGKAEPILTIVRAMIAYSDSAKDYFG